MTGEDEPADGLLSSTVSTSEASIHDQTLTVVTALQSHSHTSVHWW